MTAFRPSRAPRPSRPWGSRLLVVMAVPLLVMPFALAVFIGARCDAPASPGYSRPLDPSGVPGYTGAEAITFLTLPAWHIVCSTDEYARFVEHASPSDFENTVGLLPASLFTSDTAEDRFAAGVAREYGAFIHHTPWYRFPFFDRLTALGPRPSSPTRGSCRRRRSCSSRSRARRCASWPSASW